MNETQWLVEAYVDGRWFLEHVYAGDKKDAASRYAESLHTEFGLTTRIRQVNKGEV